jgi:hypothetical protein
MHATTSVALTAKDKLTDDLVQACIRVGDAGEHGQPTDPVVAELATALPRTFEVAPVLNVLAQKRPQWGALYPFRVLMTSLGFTHNVNVLDFTTVEFDAEFETLVAHVLSQATTISRVVFFQCRNLTPAKFQHILTGINDPRSSVVSVSITAALYGQLRACGLPASHLTKLLPAGRGGASTVIVRTVGSGSPLAGAASAVGGGDDAPPASEGDPVQGDPHPTSVSLRSAAGEPSASDLAWARQVLRQNNIPLRNLVDPRHRGSISAYIDHLKAQGGKSKIVADEVLQARRFLLRDPASLAQDQWRRKRGRQTGDAENDEDDSDVDALEGGANDHSMRDADKFMSMARAMEVLKKFSIPLALVFTDMTTVDGKIGLLKSEVDRRLAAKAVSVAFREGGTHVRYGADQEADAEPSRKQRRGQRSAKNDTGGWLPSTTAAAGNAGGELDIPWAEGVLARHQLAPLDAISMSDVLRERLHSLFRNANTSNDAADLQRAVDIINRGSGGLFANGGLDRAAGSGGAAVQRQGLASESSVKEQMSAMTAWATATLRRTLGIGDVNALLCVRQNELEDDLDSIEAGQAERARCALNILRASKKQTLPSEAVVDAYRQLNSTTD